MQNYQFGKRLNQAKAKLTKALRKGVILAVVGISFAAPVQAGTTTADFLKWDESQQNSYFQTAISMATTIAAQTKPDIAECLNDWCYSEAELPERRNAEIVEVMPQYEAFHPSTVVLAYVESVCGRFDGN